MARKVILYISQSLDGFIADDEGGVDWIFGNKEDYNGDYGYDAFVKDVDTVILGSNTYRQIVNELSPDQWAYEDLRSYVLTSKKLKDTPNIKFTSLDIKRLVYELQSKDGKNIWICGGANLVDRCIKADIIDEYRITTVPVILGSGIRLFGENNKKIKLKLTELREENGLVTGVYIKK